MKEKYLTPSAETVLFDINRVSMTISLTSLDDGENTNNLLENIGNGLVTEE